MTDDGLHLPGAGRKPVVHCAGIDPYILDSWKRSADQHQLDEWQPDRPHVLTSAEIRRQREPLEWLLSVAEPDIATLYGRISDAGYVVMVADVTGSCISMIRNPLMDRELASGGLELGRIYAETIEGTSGIGTCIVEHKPVVVHRNDHFLAVHKTVTCTAVPIDAPDGSLMAVLDVSALSSHEDKRSQLLALQLTKITAESIENKLILSNRRANQFIVYLYDSPLVAQGASDAFFLMREDGWIDAASKAAIRMLPSLGSRAGRRHLEDCVGISVQVFLDRHSRSNFAESRLFAPSRSTPLFARVDLSSARVASPAASNTGAVTAKTIDIDAREPNVDDLQELAGDDANYRKLVATVPRVLKNGLPVLVLGETGSGKEMFAHAFHRASERGQKAFVAVNCAALPESLIESELFGYREGAFTGSRKGGARGKILEADGGTLFLDEIGDMPLAMQARLLRVIAQREVIPLGGTTPVTVDFRLICATHRHLPDMVAAGTFREDLFYRINGAVFELPAFRERTDKPALIRKLMDKALGQINPGLSIDDTLIEALSLLRWPGNIRQLDHAIRYAVSVAERRLCADDFPTELRHALRKQGNSLLISETVSETEHTCAEARELIRALEENRWQIKATSIALGISRATIYRRMERYGIVEPNKRRSDH